ncbi:MBL fold metallo-hydrolase [Pedobacter mucosus]|uniref:MBL fold metallo-hydrolase n=1 Tax=Pedobacter mucosus TaxID=2895286 RepID=UPI001EE469B4|nr:MBL fold metallo-hydrolase [Pedobacter mucosus]UKT65633.1 MBL fold metallo-hydrolase [Pedobacter mucosus]
MKLHTINTGFFKLDGGAMFGVVPKAIWQKTNPADANNMCTWAMRSLLIEDGNQLTLIDTGIGDKQDDKFFSHFYLHGDDSIGKSLNNLGFSKADITDVFLTHLHFDHVGGAIIRNGENFITAFNNANYWSNEKHWQWAVEPNAREKASFLKENIIPIQESGQLKFVEESEDILWRENVNISFAYGHTDAMMLPKISYKGRTIVYVADLLPSVGHLPLPYVMAYDMFPLKTLTEKQLFLEEAVEKNYILFLEHDPINECCTLQRTEKGIRVAETFKLSDL